MKEEGVPMEDIQKWMGHSDVSTTLKIYAHFENSQHLKSANKIVNALEN